MVSTLGEGLQKFHICLESYGAISRIVPGNQHCQQFAGDLHVVYSKASQSCRHMKGRNYTIDILCFLKASCAILFHLNELVKYIDNTYRNAVKLG